MNSPTAAHASPSSNKLLRAFERAKNYPGGRNLLSMYVCRVAPYFKTVGPVIERLEPGYCQARLRDRAKVRNHIGTVHVIAICNGLEFAMGVVAEASIPAHLRWIPKGMQVDYVGKANSDITLIAQVAPSAWQAGDVDIDIQARRADGQPVVKGYIRLWVSEKPPR